MGKALKITISGKTQSLRKWCIKLHLNYSTVKSRLKHDWSILEVLELAPPKPFIDKILEKIDYHPETNCWNWMDYLDKKGYGWIRIGDKMIHIHRFMYQYFYGIIPEDKPLICHHCDNPKCCNPKHLYAGTPKDNMQDRSKRNPLSWLSGEKHGMAKLTEKQVLEIRASDEPYPVIAKRFNVNRATISHIITRKTWKHID